MSRILVRNIVLVLVFPVIVICTMVVWGSSLANRISNSASVLVERLFRGQP